MPSLLGAEHVQGLRPDLGVGLALQGEQADLGAIAMGEHELMVGGELGHGAGGHGDIVTLSVGVGRLSVVQQGVATQGHDDPHPAIGSRSGAAPHILGWARVSGRGQDRSSTS